MAAQIGPDARSVVVPNMVGAHGGRADAAITSSNFPIGFRSVEARNFGRDPARAAIRRSKPRNAPTHHVAIIPQTRPNNVGECVAKTGGWNTEKYSTQMRAVT